MSRRALFVLGLCLLATSPALAHKLSVFASAAGAEIEGKAYFKGGQGARGIAIRILGPDGTLLGEAETDSEGRFHFTATKRTDHVITAEVGDGHQAEFTVRASELPGSLPGGTGQTAAPQPDMAALIVKTEPSEDISAQVEKAIARQLRPLREQIAALEDEIRLRDILGGIGYILGIAGLLAWLGARRKGRDG